VKKQLKPLSRSLIDTFHVVCSQNKLHRARQSSYVVKL